MKYHEKMNTKKIEKEIMSIVSALKQENKIHLAKCIEENWNKTAIEYSRELNSWEPKKPMERELLLAFKKELDRLGTEDSEKSEILHSLEKRRILQTAPHLVATNGPRMFCINWLSSLGVEKDSFYVVAMVSGVPFSNNFRPGRINKKDDPVNLFGSNMQDGLVYRSIIQDKLVESIKKVPSQISKFFPQATVGESYTKWALLTCQDIEQKILEKNNMFFLDINEVISNYLIQVLENKDHIFYKIFFDEKTRKEFVEIFPNETMFYCPVKNGKYEKMENMVFDGSNLKSKNKEILLDPKILIIELKENRACPALIVVFLTLAFLNQFKCFGSFYQVEYLPTYQKQFAKLKFMEEFNIEQIPTANLTTGVFPEEKNMYPIDIITNIEKNKFTQDEDILFGELLLPLRDKLIEGRNHKNENK